MESERIVGVALKARHYRTVPHGEWKFAKWAARFSQFLGVRNISATCQKAMDGWFTGGCVP
jgi:hypothetical protein